MQGGADGLPNAVERGAGVGSPIPCRRAEVGDYQSRRSLLSWTLEKEALSGFAISFFLRLAYRVDGLHHQQDRGDGGTATIFLSFLSHVHR